MSSKVQLDNRWINDVKVTKETHYKGFAKMTITNGVVNYEPCEESEATTLVRIVEEYTKQRKGRSSYSLSDKLFRRSVFDLGSGRLLTCSVNMSVIIPSFIDDECSTNLEKAKNIR